MTGYRYSTLGIAGGIAGVAAGYFLGAEFVEASRSLFNAGALEKVAFNHPYLVPCVSALVSGASGVIVGEAGREIARRVYDFFRPIRESIPAVEFSDRKRSRE